LAEMQAKTSSQIDQLRSQIENLDAQIAKIPAARRDNLISQRDAPQGQLELSVSDLAGPSPALGRSRELTKKRLQNGPDCIGPTPAELSAGSGTSH
jgi:hypothetical protein